MKYASIAGGCLRQGKYKGVVLAVLPQGLALTILLITGSDSHVMVFSILPQGVVFTEVTQGLVFTTLPQGVTSTILPQDVVYIFLPAININWPCGIQTGHKP